MKNYIVYSVIMLFFVVSCSKESNESIEESDIQASDFTISLEENPENETSIGFIDATSNTGTLSYSLIEQNPTGALGIDSETGELKVTNKSLFEYQLFPTILATVNVTNGVASKDVFVTINLLERTKIFYGDVILKTQEEVIDFGNEKYTEISGYLIVGGLDGEDITDLTPLEGLNFIRNYLVISFNKNLSNLNGIESLIDVRTFVQISHNINLSNINGLKNLSNVGDPNYLSSGSISIMNNEQLTNLDGLLGLTNVIELGLLSNLSLTSVEGLANINNIESIVIYNNSSLTNLNGLENLSSISNLIKIVNNPYLSDFCALQNCFNSFDFNGDFEIESNEYNPTKEQIIEGECSL